MQDRGAEFRPLCSTGVIKSNAAPFMSNSLKTIGAPNFAGMTEALRAKDPVIVTSKARLRGTEVKLVDSSPGRPFSRLICEIKP
jgi:hypothetical protein